MVRRKHTLRTMPCHATHDMPWFDEERRLSVHTCVGKGAASRHSHTCVDPHYHPDEPLLLKVEPCRAYLLIKHKYVVDNTCMQEKL